MSGSEPIRAALRAGHTTERIARNYVPPVHALPVALDSHVPGQALKLMAAVVAS
jgi:hypothetical protein